MKKRITGRDAFIELLLDEGVDHLFGNPGTTELAVMEAVARYPQMKYVLGLQESLVLGMADGFARATNRLAACNLHCTPGLGHAMGALYSAKFSGSPVLITAGQYEIGYGLQEPMLYEPLVEIARPLVKWSAEVPRLEDLPRILRRAAKIALTPPMGPVFLSLPGSVLDEEMELDLGVRTRVEASVRPGDAVLQRLAERLLQAQSPVILAGREIAHRDAFGLASEFATLLGAAVWHEPIAYNARFPTDHPAFMGDLTRNQVKVRKTLEAHDLVICLGADLLRMSPLGTVDPLPEGMPVVHLSDRDWELGKNYPTEWALRADVRETLSALLPRLRAQRSAEHEAAAAQRLAGLATRNWAATRASLRQQHLALADAQPIDARYLMMVAAETLPQDVVVVEEALTSTPALAAHLPMNDEKRFFGLSSGGLGFAMPGAVGIALGLAPRRVVAVVGDGSSLYSIQALWTAAHFRLPITYLIINNRGYRIIKERLMAMRGTDRFLGMDFTGPELDFVSIARGFGMDAVRITQGEDIAPALRAAVEGEGPRLIEVVVSNGFEGRTT